MLICSKLLRINFFDTIKFMIKNIATKNGTNAKKEMSPRKEDISKSLASQRSNQVRIIPQRLRL